MRTSRDDLVELLWTDRNSSWLGQPAPASRRRGEPGTAAGIVAALDESYGAWRAVLEATTEQALAAAIGEPAGRRYRTATRRSFVLHVLDELIHHGAEVALLRDVYRLRHPL